MDHINSYLTQLPKSVHLELYGSPETCLAVFRLLPPLAKLIIMTLLFQPNPTPNQDLLRMTINNKNLHNAAIDRLKSLHLLQESKKTTQHPTTGKPITFTFVQVNDTFKKSFKDALGGLTPSEVNEVTFNIQGEKASEKISTDFLDRWCLNKWERILHFMVGSQNESQSVPDVSVLRLLRFAGLMEMESDKKFKEDNNVEQVVFDSGIQFSLYQLRDLSITQSGFQFLLQEINNQIWTLLIQYLLLSETKNKTPVDVLKFIFLLGSLELGQRYPISNLTTNQKEMLTDLSEFGLIYREDKGSFFYPTRLSIALTSESSSFKSPSSAIDNAISSQNESSSSGTIIIETNFKIYCYTTSPLQIALLSLFTHLRTRFSNLVTGSLTRESIRKALSNGITAEQIIAYLSSHAHPGMIRSAEETYAKKYEFEASIGNTTAMEKLSLEVLPPTVVDQIRLWQLELERIKPTSGYLWSDIGGDWEKLVNYGEEQGWIVWKDRVKGRFFVRDEGQNGMVDYAGSLRRGRVL
ncbi:TFIIH/NER complex subunit [Martiniozyma asiatica (nom. inval.)]|nr:TFIIH/NER complex subunit [Martiniozyma asiatica]